MNSSVMQQILKNTKMLEPMINRRVNAPMNVHYDSLVKIEGDVVDADRIIRQMENVSRKIADQRIDKSWREFSDELKYN